MYEYIRSDVRECARCGNDHSQLIFYPFTSNAIVCGDAEFTHYGTCPMTMEPVILRIVDDDRMDTPKPKTKSR